MGFVVTLVNQMFCLPMFAEQKWGKGLKITSLVSSKALEAGG